MDKKRLIRIVIGTTLFAVFVVLSIVYYDKNRDIGKGFSEMVRQKNENLKLRDDTSRRPWGAVQ